MTFLLRLSFVKLKHRENSEVNNHDVGFKSVVQDSRSMSPFRPASALCNIFHFPVTWKWFVQNDFNDFGVEGSSSAAEGISMTDKRAGQLIIVRSRQSSTNDQKQLLLSVARLKIVYFSMCKEECRFWKKLIFWILISKT